MTLMIRIDPLALGTGQGVDLVCFFILTRCEWEWLELHKYSLKLGNYGTEIAQTF